MPQANLWPLALYAGLVLVVVVVMLGLSYLLGERHRDPATGNQYESGMPPTGSARVRLSAKFYLVAMFFVLFDLETVFLIAWAVAFRELGWLGYMEVLVFVGVLFAALIYLWRRGALDWGTSRRKAEGGRSQVAGGRGKAASGTKYRSEAEWRWQVQADAGAPTVEVGQADEEGQRIS